MVTDFLILFLLLQSYLDCNENILSLCLSLLGKKMSGKKRAEKLWNLVRRSLCSWWTYQSKEEENLFITKLSRVWNKNMTKDYTLDINTKYFNWNNKRISSLKYNNITMRNENKLTHITSMKAGKAIDYACYWNVNFLFLLFGNSSWKISPVIN